MKSIRQRYTGPQMHVLGPSSHANLLVTSWEMTDESGDNEDDFGIIEGDPEGGLSTKQRYGLWEEL